MDGQDALKIIEETGIPKASVARLAGVHQAVLYKFISGQSVSSLNKHLILVAIEELQQWIATLPFPPSFKDWEAVQSALTEHRVKRMRAAGIQVIDEPEQDKEVVA